LLFLHTCAFPSLRLGKRIDEKDRCLLFLPITSRDDSGTCADKDELDRWCALHKKDPRSKSSQSYGLDAAKQTSILTWVANNTAGYVPPAQAPVGRPHGYTLNFGAYAGCTLSQLARDGTSRKLKPSAAVPGGPTLLWITSPSFTWRFPQHVALFLALLELERSGCRTHGNSGEELIDARHARAAYEQYARPDLEPRDDDREVLAVGDEIDPNLFEPLGAAFATAGQYEVRSHCCRWVRPPRRLLLVTVASETVEEAWSRDAVRAAWMEARGQCDREAAVGDSPRERHHP
jgi:hypothetical protein